MQDETVNIIEANGLKFAYKEAGEGPLLLCLHGYPDTADTWDEHMPVLAQAGYHVVAPYTRGYWPTQIPEPAAYANIDLGTDVLALIEGLGYAEAVVLGHDWGALAAYTAANLAPEKISKLITVAIPHPRVLRFTPAVLWRSRHFITYQFRRLAVWNMKHSNFKHIDAIYRRWSPNWDFAEQDLKAIKSSLAQPGVVEAVLGYYWAFAERRSSGGPRVSGKKTSVSTLCLVGDADGALSLDVMEDTPSAFTGEYRYEVLPEAGHFLHREAPERFLELVLNFLNE
ncbi:MAG: alpha/beta hydrolase [Chloroflexi bacterium]|nr:MAG: alpha/beta hydrolase [Chloroflexota bacterium]MBL1195882.1 alpha/beta hydrolase [Chloroflexota bacterium]NOH13174.1 alpha/beta hydrolase [Chloroflexota bacterium]